MTNNYQNKKKIKTSEIIIISGICLAIGGATLWVINFFGMYSIPSQDCSRTLSICDAKLSHLAHLRGVGQEFILAGLAVTSAGAFLRKNTHSR